MPTLRQAAMVAFEKYLTSLWNLWQTVSASPTLWPRHAVDLIQRFILIHLRGLGKRRDIEEKTLRRPTKRRNAPPLEWHRILNGAEWLWTLVWSQVKINVRCSDFWLTFQQEELMRSPTICCNVRMDRIQIVALRRRFCTYRERRRLRASRPVFTSRCLFLIVGSC